ncbi:bone morphogenetic protein 2-A-like isoform X1 [Pocillopora damicornis]|uniref:bone morphogenetic protein 2-A-like isoform X1 n=1 Tax=Pocillopora damicornis TaxID=46731 RepID=UPI000F559344|nr:bone morphogenetic protein 2-A-like isoform X1 [Pocillopora damicornis]
MLNQFVSLFVLHLFILSLTVSGRGMFHKNRLQKTSRSEEPKNSPETKGPKKHFSSLIQGGSAEKHNEVQIEPFSSKETESKLLPEKKEDEADACRRVPMYVSFSDLQNSTLFDLVIAPSGFNAFRCVGKCISGEANNYSLMMTILNSKNKSYPTDGSRSCCVPIKWRSVSLLVFQQEKVLLRKFDNMIVQECGCI